MFSIRRVRNVGAPATVGRGREREKRRKIWMKAMCLDLLASYQGAAWHKLPLRREQWEWSENGHRRRNRATRKCHKQRPWKGRNGGTDMLCGTNSLKEGAM
jgi:hypothetical protein